MQSNSPRLNPTPMPETEEIRSADVTANISHPPKKRLIKRMRGKANKAMHTAFRKLFPANSDDEENFDFSSVLSLVCTLGYLSFRAYKDPSVLGFEEFTTSACRVQHLNWEDLNDSIEGVLKIDLQRARNVIDSDIGSKSDPYCVFSTGWSQVASAVVKNDHNPVWNSTHYLLIRKNSVIKNSNSKLRVRMFDSDWHSGRTEEREFRRWLVKDDSIGEASLDLAELIEGGVKRHELSLHIDGDDRPQKTVVLFSTEFMPFDRASDLMGKPFESDAWLQKIEEGEDECKWTGMAVDVDISHVTFQPIAFINAVKTGTQVWIHANPEAKAIVVAIRGTEAGRPKDLLTDLRFVPTKLKLKCDREFELGLRAEAADPSIKAHSGFKGAYNSVRLTLLELVYDICEWSEEWTICVTGHSLGGAVATLCAFEFANRLNEIGKTPRIIMMNFGAPKIGNNDFVKVYKETVKESYRIVNKMDIIHKLPFLLKHVDIEVDFTEDGEVLVNKKKVGDLGRSQSSSQDEGGLGNHKPKKLTKRGLFKTPGFKGHFENYYYDLVTRAIDTIFKSNQERFEDFLEGVTRLNVKKASSVP